MSLFYFDTNILPRRTILVDMFKQFDCNNLQHVDNQENSIKNRVDVIANIFAKQPVIIQNQLEIYA